ncbi:unnamed protein product [Ilex paraguariensis]|uniref:H15 domain-containing protein n=1 Tax=Ilex paraguariensis TaxID=185542 RepID=A0ABC8SPC9_9AQUA
MSATGEVENATVEQPAAEVAAAEEQPKVVEKPVKEKKPRGPKEKKQRVPKTAAHPPYFQMIKEALLALNEKGGSSPYAIAKYMEEKHKAVLPANFRKIMGLQLKNSAAKGKLIKIKASYELSASGKKDMGAKTVPKSTVAAKKQPKRVKSTTTTRANAAKKTEAVKKTAKKIGVAKKTKKSEPTKAKQPKSIKSPAAKRSRRAVAKA